MDYWTGPEGIRLTSRVISLETQINAIDRLLKSIVTTMDGMVVTDTALLESVKALAERVSDIDLAELRTLIP